MGFFSSAKAALAAQKLAEERRYALALEEIASNNIRPGLWAKATADTGGNEEAAKARYIKLLVELMKAEDDLLKHTSSKLQKDIEREQRQEEKRRQDSERTQARENAKREKAKKEAEKWAAESEKLNARNKKDVDDYISNKQQNQTQQTREGYEGTGWIYPALFFAFVVFGIYLNQPFDQTESDPLREDQLECERRKPEMYQDALQQAKVSPDTWKERGYVSPEAWAEETHQIVFELCLSLAAMKQTDPDLFE